MREKREKEVIICDDCKQEVEDRLARWCYACKKDLCNKCAIETTVNVHSGIISPSWNAKSIHSCKEHYIVSFTKLMDSIKYEVINTFNIVTGAKHEGSSQSS